MALKKVLIFFFISLVFSKQPVCQTVNTLADDAFQIFLKNHDSTAKLQIHKITITGNKRTKQYIILREIQFNEGDSIIIANLFGELKKAKQQVYNTTLFNEVKIVPVMISAYQVDIKVDVEERWYIYPIPQFKIVDRSLNEWLVKYNGDLDRVNYGIKFQHYNLTGRRDVLKVNILNGYTQHLSLAYTQPYSNSSLTEGFGVAASYTQTREVAYNTTPGNTLLYYKDGNFSNKIIGLGFSYILRKRIRNKHLFGITYFHISVNDSVLHSNPGYFNSSDPSQNIVDLSYTYQYVDVNNVGYPLYGTQFLLGVLKRGIKLEGGTNMFAIESSYSRYWDLKKRWYGDIKIYGRIKLPFDQAYINRQGLGYLNNYLRGLQYYVIDGPLTGYIRSTLKKRIVNFSIPFPIKSISHTKIPFRIFAKSFADMGYVYNKLQYDTYLNRRLLYTGGFGIDIVTLYDINLRFEYCFNQLKQNGLFLHAQSGF